MTVARPSGVPGESTSGVVPRLGAPLGRVHECGAQLERYRGKAGKLTMWWKCCGCGTLVMGRVKA